jgi:segregation and condensation protein B
MVHMAEQRNEEHMRVAEAALFVSGKAMGLDDIAKVLGVASMGYVKKLMEELMHDYEGNKSALTVVNIGDKYALAVKSAYASKVNDLAGAPDISKGALRILAYIGRNEPIMQNSIVKAFGSSTYDHMKELLEKEFVTSQKKGRTRRIETTQKFREYFSIS